MRKAVKKTLEFFRWWLGTAAFIVACYLLLWPVEWYMDWVFSGSFNRALAIMLIQTAAIAAALKIGLAGDD